MSFEYPDLDYDEVKKNLYKQSKHVMNTIIDSYFRGTLDDASNAHVLCGLLACVCEGKVKGTFNEDTKVVTWSLTHDFEKEVAALQEALGLGSENVVKGPW